MGRSSKKEGLIVVRLVSTLVIIVVLSLLPVQPLSAQTMPPNRFYGRVTVDGQSVSDGTVVSVWVANIKRAEAITVSSNYVLDLAQAVGENLVDKTVTFKIIFGYKQLDARETARWEGGGVTKIDLTGSTQAIERSGAPIAVTLQPTKTLQKRGQPFDVSVMASIKQSDVWRGEITVSFDPKVLKFTGMAKGALLVPEPMLDVSKIEDGKVTYIFFRTKLPLTSLSDGELVRLSLRVRNDATSSEGKISLSVISFADENAKAAAVTGKDSFVAVSILGTVGDINGDGVVDFRDVSLLTAGYGFKQGDGLFDPRSDLNEDGETGIEDLAILAGNMGRKG